MSSFNCRSFSVLILVVFAGGAAGQDTPPEEEEPQEERQINLTVSLDGGAAHQFDADIDDGGDYNVTRFDIGANLSMQLNEGLSVALRLGYAHDGYDFAGSQGFGGLDPWDNVHTFAASVQLNWAIDNQWVVWGGPMLRFSAEDGADAGALTGGGMIGASYRASEHLTIGGGIGALSQIEDDVSVFPIITVNWKVADDWTVRTGGDVGASGGGRVEVAWQATEEWELALGGGLETRRFRLDDDGIALDGVGEEETMPIFARFTYRADDNASFSLLAGIVVAGELTLEDDDGDTIIDEDIDPAPFIAARFSVRF